MATSVHEQLHDHVNVHEPGPAPRFTVDVDVYEHVDVIGFFISGWAAPCYQPENPSPLGKNSSSRILCALFVLAVNAGRHLEGRAVGLPPPPLCRLTESTYLSFLSMWRYHTRRPRAVS